MKRLQSGVLLALVTSCLTLLNTSALLAQTSWRGTTSTDWRNASNWTAGIPNSSIDAIIGDANFTGANQPTISGNSSCRSLTIGASNKVAVLTVSKSLVVSGNLTIGPSGTLAHNGNNA